MRRGNWLFMLLWAGTAQAETPPLVSSALSLDVYAATDTRVMRLQNVIGDSRADLLMVRPLGATQPATLTFTQPSRYHWMLQYYLRAEGLALSWVGTGRIIFPIAFDEAAFDEVVWRFVAAARAMRDDGWWWQGESMTGKALRRQVLRETLRVRLRRGG